MLAVQPPEGLRVAGRRGVPWRRGVTSTSTRIDKFWHSYHMVRVN